MGRQDHTSKSKTAGLRAVVAGLAVGLAVLGAAELGVFRATAAENDARRAKLDRLRAENARTEQMIGAYDEFEREAARVDAEFKAAIEAVPTEAELASVLDDLERVTAASGVDLVRFAPGAPAAQRAAPSHHPATQQAPAGLQTRPILATIRCRFGDFRGLLGRLAAYPRLLTVESFTMRSATAGIYTVEATVGMNCYFKQAPAEARPTAK